MSNYFEWMGAGFLEGKGHGVAMHESVSLIKGCYFGFDEASFYLRVDIDRAFIPDIADLCFEITIVGKETFQTLYRVKGKKLESPLPAKIVFSDILEMQVPLKALGVKADDKISLGVSIKTKEMQVGRIPSRGYLTIKVPSENFEMEMWYV